MATSDQHPKKTAKQSTFAMQAGLVIVAAIVAGLIVMSGKSETSVNASKEKLVADTEMAFNMLAYMDSKTVSRESKMDVRCWSSMSDLQQFITQCKISSEAKSTRTRLHANHLESLWEAARDEQGDGDYIAAETLRSILNRHYTSRQTDNGLKFDFNDEPATVMLFIHAQAEDDYEKTIETWRLLQNWATGHISKKGQFTLKPQFDQEALDLMYSFLRSFDLAILKKAGEIAKEDRLSEITPESVEKAFVAMRRKSN